MQVTKVRTSGGGPVPAGRYFAQIAENLRAQNTRSTAEVAQAETQEHRLEARYRKTHKGPSTAHVRHEHAAAPM